MCAASGVSTASPSVTTAPTPAQFPIIVPKLSINIPTIDLGQFANVTQSNGYVYIPFISVYLVGAYKLGIGIASILAIIMIMAGGLVWIAAAGDAGKIGKAKSMITGAVIGLVLTLGSYVALQTVNPDLVNFTALKIKTVSPPPNDIFSNYNPEIGGAATGAAGNVSSPSQYDSIFAKYAPCAGITPGALKAIALAEDGSLNPSATNGSYVGLFQTNAANCPASVKSYCGDLTNPDNNTAVGAAQIGATVNTINSNCSNPSAHDQLVMIYIGHNMGGGFLKNITQNGCDVSTMRQAAINYYANTTNGQSTAAKYAPNYQAACVGSNTDAQTYANCTGGPKFDYAMKIADKTMASGVSQVITDSPSGTCPY
jgi:hypothetical protein